jgi:hypothetical protein
MKKVKCMLDEVKFNKKPNGFETGAIQKRMAQTEIEIEDLANLLKQGASFKPALLDGMKSKGWLEQQLFGLDFDHATTVEEQLNLCTELGIMPCFGYTTFNHLVDKGDGNGTEERFRLVFCTDEVITDIALRNKLQVTLIRTFSKSDEVTKDQTRIFYGGKSSIYNNYDNRINTQVILDAYYKEEYQCEINELNRKLGINNTKVKSSETKFDNDVERVDNILIKYNNSSNILATLSQDEELKYNLKALRNRDVEYLKNNINNKPITFENDGEFWHYIYHNINMAELLELKYPSSIKCIFHEDSTPSASVFQNDEGVWLYKCHSGKCGLVMNVKQLIEKLGNFKSEHKAIEFIKNIYNLSIKETDWSIEQKNNLQRILDNINLNKFSEICPQTDKNIRYIKELFTTIVTIAKNNVYGENYTNSDGDVVFFLSLSELAKITKTAENHLNRLSQRISVLVYHDLMRKLDDCKIPEQMLKKAQALAIEKGHDKRVNFYSIPSWVFEQVRKIEIQGNKWKQKGYTIKGASYEMYYRGDGLEVAQLIYPQHKKIINESVDYETGEIITTSVDRTTSVQSNSRVSQIVEIIESQIDKKYYTTEKEIVLGLSKNYRWEVTEIQLRKIRGELESLGYKRIRANKEIKEQCGIQSNGYPMIVVRNT